MDLKIQPGTLVDWFVESRPPPGKGKRGESETSGVKGMGMSCKMIFH